MNGPYLRLKEVSILKKQNIATFIFILTLIVSIYLTYNEQQQLLNKKTFTSSEFDRYLNLFNRIIGILILIALLYINYEQYNLAKEKRIDSEIFLKNIFASILNLIAGLIVLYIVFESLNEENDFGPLENPIT